MIITSLPCSTTSRLFLVMENHHGRGVMLDRGIWLLLSTRMPPRQPAGITHQSKCLVVSHISWILLQGLKHVITYVLNYV